MKLCKDCNNLIKNDLFGNSNVEFWECSKAYSISPLDGENRPVPTEVKYCDLRRNIGNKCGPEGKEWEPSNEDN